MKKLLGIVVLGLLFCNTVLALPKCVGEDTSKWTMCEGTKIFDSELTYVGEWKDGKRHGKGTGSYPSGACKLDAPKEPSVLSIMPLYEGKGFHRSTELYPPCPSGKKLVVFFMSLPSTTKYFNLKSDTAIK